MPSVMHLITSFSLFSLPEAKPYPVPTMKNARAIMGMMGSICVSMLFPVSISRSHPFSGIAIAAIAAR